MAHCIQCKCSISLHHNHAILYKLMNFFFGLDFDQIDHGVVCKKLFTIIHAPIMIFWNSINEGHRKILSIMHTNGSCIASTYHTYQHVSYLYICCTVSAQWICFSFIFQQFYGVFFTHDQIECTLAKWTQRMTVMKWSFVFLLFGLPFIVYLL